VFDPELVYRNVNAIIVKATYGYQITGNDDSLVDMLEYAFQLGGTITVPGKYLVEMVPSCESRLYIITLEPNFLTFCCF
jgi:hypothetical protein